MMIPLRRALIVQQHGILKYPEGTACAEVLKAGASAESRAAARRRRSASRRCSAAPATSADDDLHRLRRRARLQGAEVAFNGWKDMPEKIFGAAVRRRLGRREISPELLGVGYIIGPRIASIMAPAACSSYLLLIPLDQVLRRRTDAAARAGHHADQRHAPDDDSRRLHPLHRRGRGGGRRHHQPDAIAADDLARPASKGCRTSAADSRGRDVACRAPIGTSR